MSREGTSETVKGTFTGRSSIGADTMSGELRLACGNEIHKGTFKGLGLTKGQILKKKDDGRFAILYEGDLLNGRYHGAGSLFDVQTGDLVYEGRFQNGEFHGKGALFGNGRFCCKGDFARGKCVGQMQLEWKDGRKYIGGSARLEPNGKGRYFRADGTLEYEGEVHGGKRHGQGKEFRADGTLQYEGKFRNGKRHGPGKEFRPDGSPAYEGEFHGGKRHGQGKVFRDVGNIRVLGYFEHGVIQTGKSFRSDGTLAYDGQFGKLGPSGKGKCFRADGTLEYEGEVLGGKRCGHGKLYRPDGKTLEYEGELHDGSKHGKGKLFADDGKTIAYEGGFQDGNKHGQGVLFRNDGTLWYRGGFENNTFHGKGQCYDFKEKLYLDGIFKQGNIQSGKKISAEGLLAYEGEFSDEKFHGQGVLYRRDGLTLRGTWDQDVFVAGEIERGTGIKHRGTFKEGRLIDGLIETPVWKKKIGGVLTGYQIQTVAGEVVQPSCKFLRPNRALWYEGEMKHFRFSGPGVVYRPNGNKHYEGVFSGDKCTKGSRYSANGTLEYTGRFRKEKFDTRDGPEPGASFGPDGAKTYEGGWKLGRRHGFGVLFEKGKPVYSGNFERGEPVGLGLDHETGQIKKRRT